MTQPFQKISRYYDLLYQEKDSAAEALYVDQLLKRYGVSGCHLLEFGSGTGRHGRLLAERGYTVYGIERNEEMVAEAKQSFGFNCERGDIIATHLNRKFDAVISLFHVISYQTTNSGVQAVFANAARHLDLGGLFLFDVWYSPAVMSQRPGLRVKRLNSEQFAVTRIAEPKIYPNDNRVDVHYTIFAQDLASGDLDLFEEIHPMRHFSLPELQFLAQSAGFKLLGAEEWLTGHTPSEDTWGVCLILRKQ